MSAVQGQKSILYRFKHKLSGKNLERNAPYHSEKQLYQVQDHFAVVRNVSLAYNCIPLAYHRVSPRYGAFRRGTTGFRCGFLCFVSVFTISFQNFGWTCLPGQLFQRWSFGKRLMSCSIGIGFWFLNSRFSISNLQGFILFVLYFQAYRFLL